MSADPAADPADRPLLVTSALPYANGPLHFGHVAGAYLPADIYVRFRRLVAGLGPEPAHARFEADEAAGAATRAQRRDPGVLYACGTDEHGVAITVNAEKEGVDYQAYVDRWHAEIAGLFDRFAISFDVFSRTTHREPHYRLSQEFFLRLLREGRVHPQTQKQHYCVTDRRFLPDRYVTGTCYLCGAPNARGDECKKCGEWLDPIRLVDPKCLTCGNTPEIRDAMQYELDLRASGAAMLAGHDAAGGAGALPAAPSTDGEAALARLGARIRDWKPNVRTTVIDKQLKEDGGLTSRPITRDLPWGVPLPATDLAGAPIEGHAGKKLYVWFDAPIGYVSATAEWARDVLGQPIDDGASAWRRYWIERAGHAPELVHFIGKDNIVFHCVVFPTMLAFQGESAPGATLPAGSGDFAGRPLLGPRAGERWTLPVNVPANEFYNLEGRKFSTSDGWTLDNARLFELFGVDALRWYLARSMPETADGQFTFAGLQVTVNAELADVIGNYASRVIKFAHAQLGGVVPEPDEAWASEAGADLRAFLGHRGEGGNAGTDGSDAALVRRAREAVMALSVDPPSPRPTDESDSKLGVGSALWRLDKAVGSRGGFRVAAERLVDFGRLGNQVFDRQAPWKLRKGEGGTDPRSPCATSIWCHLQMLATLSVLLTPFVPGAAQRLRRMLGLRNTALPAGHAHEWLAAAWTPTGLAAPPVPAHGSSTTGPAGSPSRVVADPHDPGNELRPGHRLGEPGILFAKIPDEVIEAERAALAARAGP